MSQFKNMKFKVGSNAEAAALQEYLFAQGYKWFSGQRVDYTGSRVFFVDEEGCITHQFSDYNYFENQTDCTEMEVKFTPVVASISEKNPTRTTLSGLYTKKQLEEIIQAMD